MNGLRLIADDLTGALDSAVHFVPAMGPINVTWSGGVTWPGGALPPGAVALDAGTREMTARAARAVMAGLAPLLAPAPDILSFLKLDSLLRGHAGADIATMAGQGFAHVIIAPALPAQGRITRAGRQFIRQGGEWQAVGEDIAATLRKAGSDIALCEAGALLPAGISLWSAAGESDLDLIVQGGLAARGPVLWCGSGGLAAALARALPAGAASAEPALRLPVLGLVGSDHPVAQGQLATAAPVVALEAGMHGAAEAVARMMDERGLALVRCTFAAPPGREAARAEISARFAGLVDRLPAPGALYASGGETLSAILRHLGARGLRVHGELAPGVPLSVLVGGRWSGLPVLSKSGAFGPADLYSTLFAAFTRDPSS